MCLSWLKLSKTKDLELLTSVIKEYYSFLGDTEIKNFLSLHPQLRKERDFSVVEACLEKYLRHEAQKYNVLLSSYEAAHKEDRFTTNDDQPLLRRIDKKSKKKIKAETKYTADEIERANFLAAKHERRLDSNPNLYIGTKTSAYYKNPRGTYKNEPNEIISSKISEDNQRPNYVAEAELDNASLKQRNPQKEGLKDKKPEDNNGQGLYLDPIREENKGEESRNTRLELGEAICTQGKVEEDSTLPSDSVEEEEQVKEYRKRMREKFNYGLEAEENPVVQSYNFRRMGEEEVIPIIEQRRRQMLAAGITDTDELLSSDPRVQLGNISIYCIISYL